MIGFTSAFMMAGASTLITTLWDVNDKYTAELMTAFYREWLVGGNNKAEALRQAQLKMIETLSGNDEFPHPFRWGAFLLTGDYFSRQAEAGT